MLTLGLFKQCKENYFANINMRVHASIVIMDNEPINGKKYSARLTGNQFLYNEFKVIVKLVCAGLSKKEISNKIIDENLFEYRSLKSIGKHIGAVYERADYIDEVLSEKLLTEPNEIGRLINFYAILKYDLLFLEFVEEVVREKVRTHQLELTRADISNFFSLKAEQSDIVAGFKEATLKRLRLAYFELLLGAGYLIKTDTEMKLNVPIAAYQISDYLESINEKRYAKAMIGV